jgi:lactate racemase
VIIVGADDPDLIRSAKFMAEPTMEAAIARAAGELGSDLDVLIVPHALLTLPIVQNSLGHTAH